MKTKGAILAWGFFVFAILVCIIAIYSMTILISINKITSELKSASEISIAALDFNVENFHTQLEVWEYAFIPSNVRLVAFQSHNKKLTELLEDLESMVELESSLREDGESSGLIQGGEEDIAEIVSDLELVRADWENVFDAIEEVERLAELGYDSADHQNHDEYEVAIINLKEKAEKNELLFDELAFNNEIDRFVTAQKNLFEDLEEAQEEASERFMVLFAVLGTLFVILSMGVFFVLLWPRLTKKKGKSR